CDRTSAGGGIGRRERLRRADGRGAILQSGRDNARLIRSRRSIPPQRLTRAAVLAVNPADLGEWRLHAAHIPEPPDDVHVRVVPSPRPRGGGCSRLSRGRGAVRAAGTAVLRWKGFRPDGASGGEGVLAGAVAVPGDARGHGSQF